MEQCPSQFIERRIMLVDDNVEIHKDFQRILNKETENALENEEALLFGTAKKPTSVSHHYKVDSAYQGQEALELAKKAKASGEPYAVAFIDMRMPPGWDGIETIKQLWAIDPRIQMVICSAYSDHSWEEITRELGDSDNLLILKKPFEVIEINQLAAALTLKWELIGNLHSLVQERTQELEHLYSLTNTTLEATQEGILAVGCDGQILKYNENFLKQWKLDRGSMTGEDSASLFRKLADQVNDSIYFLQMMTDLCNCPQTRNVKEWQLKEGSCLELYAQPQLLHDEVIGIVYSFRDISEQKELERQLLYQATHDNLTGLPNRALLLDRMNQAISHAKRFNLQLAILLVDLDFFKEVNDRYGHKMGDALLKEQAMNLSGFLRSNDTVARYGGDEFVVVLVSQPYEQDRIGFLNKLMKLFSKPFVFEGYEINSAASVGVSVYPQDGKDPDSLLKSADAALYHAKDLGRNRYQFYKKEFNEQILQRAELVVSLAQALDRKELFLNYQPLMNLKTGEIIGVEALLRWKHPTLGLVPPQTFIPIAEESGLIIDIGEWVLRTACAQAKIWHDTSAYPFLKISVNISVKQFRQNNFLDIVKTILQDTELDPHLLELEITENLILSNITEVVEKMVELKNIGIRFAVDDFGTGYSGLSYLKHFPFDTVKIDKIFIDNITTDASNASIVDAIIGMTKNMGIDVLAEGVEHNAQVNFLREHHSNQVQGYYFSHPLDATDCTRLLNTKRDKPAES